MSAVALPHVPSARAPSSATSSTQRSVHSASSTASHVSSKSQRQSYGETGDEEDEEDDGEENVSEEEEEEEPHESSSGSGSGGLWDEVESFLNKPSPSFAALAKDTANNKSSSAGANVLPTLRAGDRKHPVAPPGGNQSSGPRGSRPSIRQYAKQSASGSTKAIDPKLLQEAFAYAEKIQRVNFDDTEDDDDHHQPDQQREAERRGSGSVGMLRRDTSFGSSSGAASGGPRMPHDAALSRQGSMRGAKGDDAKAKKKKSAASAKASAYGVSVKPTPSSKKKTSSGAPAERRASSGWDASPSSTADPNGDGMAQSRKGGASAIMDQQTIQSLVSSLQNGTALDELRRELAASQQSLAMSRLVIQEAAQSFFRK